MQLSRTTHLSIAIANFYYRDRMIAAYFGCDAAFRAAMETLFGPPIVVTSSTCWRLGRRG